MTIPGAIRQLRYPREHRIRKVHLPPGVRRVVQEALEKALTTPDNTGFIVELCTRLWRADKRLQEITAHEASPDLQPLGRRFAELKDVLHAEHIEWHDYSGQQYDPGLAPRVLTLQPTAGLTEGREIVLETVKPTVYRQGKLLAPGEIIVGVPIPPGDQPRESAEKHGAQGG
jgi:hypothetical protein